MSILKAYKIENKDMVELNYETIKEEFKLIMGEAITTTDDDTRELMLKALFTAYSLYAVKYLMEVSDNLYEHPHNKDVMSYMNSALVELTYACNLKYYVKDMTYSIVDKTVQRALDEALKTDATLTEIKTRIFTYCEEVMTDIQVSHIDEDIEDNL